MKSSTEYLQYWASTWKTVCYAKSALVNWAIGEKAQNMAVIDYLNLFSLNTVGSNQRFSNQ